MHIYEYLYTYLIIIIMKGGKQKRDEDKQKADIYIKSLFILLFNKFIYLFIYVKNLLFIFY